MVGVDVLALALSAIDERQRIGSGQFLTPHVGYGVLQAAPHRGGSSEPRRYEWATPRQRALVGPREEVALGTGIAPSRGC